MPFAPPTTSSLMVTRGYSILMSGEKFAQIVDAVSCAVCQYFPLAPLVYTSNIVIGPGAGVFTATITGCIPFAMTELMTNMASSLGIGGQNTQQLLDAISFGVCNTIMTSALGQGSVIGGGPGAGQGNITNLIPINLQQMIMSEMSLRGLVGQNTEQIMQAVAFGICMHVTSSAQVLSTCIGGFAPPPAGPVTIPCAPGPGNIC